jgi:hypothetical protein
MQSIEYLSEEVEYDEEFESLQNEREQYKSRMIIDDEDLFEIMVEMEEIMLEIRKNCFYIF